ncbi:MAG: SPOR domain-containing protein [Panacagrimonas sp.]
MRLRFQMARTLVIASVAGVLAGLPLTVMALDESLGPRGELGPARMFSVDSISGTAHVIRRGSPILLQRGYLVFNGETMEVREDSRLRLFLGPFGTLEMGAGQLTASKVPAAPWARDLDTRLQLDRGDLRLQWKPEPGKNWPLAIGVGDWIARVGSGEHFFHVADGGVSVCNLLGTMEVTDTNDPAVSLAVAQDSCLQVHPGQAKVVAMPADPWTLGFGQDPDATITAEAPAAGSTVLPEPAVPPVIVGQGNVATIYSQPDAPAEPTSEWLINVISVRDPAQADQHAKTLVAAGFRARVRAETVRGQPSYRVVVSGITDGAAANGIAQQLQGRLGFTDAWALQRN